MLYMFMTPFASHIWCLDHLDGLTHLSCISRLTKMSKMTNTFYVPLMSDEVAQSNLSGLLGVLGSPSDKLALACLTFPTQATI